MFKKIPHKINLLCFILALFGNLMIKTEPPVWVGFGDPYDYLAQSKIPLSDKSFYSPTPDLKFNCRPFTLPLLYKIADSDPPRIIILQEFFNALCTFFLVYVLLLYLNRNYLKYAAIVFIYLLMSWWNIVGWSVNLLSESLFMSLLFAWLASWLLLTKKRTRWYWALHILITILFSFTRDNSPYIIVLFYFTSGFAGWLWDRKQLKQYISLFGIGIVLFIVQSYTAKIGERNKLPVLNNIVIRMMPNKEYFQWFKDNGMPLSDRLVANYTGATCNDAKIYTLYHDSTYNDLYNWINTQGTSTFIRFLLTHPKHTFLLDQTPEERARIFAYNLPGYTGDITGYSKWTSFMFPLFNKWVALLLSLCLIVKFRKHKELILLFPLLLMIVFAIHALLAYNSDALEVERHLFITNIMIQFVGILSVLLILNPSNPLLHLEEEEVSKT
jgi:hypothetical protein